nr:hypothetical protein Itr_chr01CG00870 [Ipomoea trifida]
MSGLDSQNISGRDYDEGAEAANDSYNPSSGNSTFQQIDEVENISADVEENVSRPLTSELGEETSTSGRGKSPWVVISVLFPHFDPPTV